MGFAIRLTEKIEDLINILFLPIYFALSGLKSNIGLLDDGITWMCTIVIIVIALMGKIFGGMLASHIGGLPFRESLTIGVLMSCKGLFELIVLNIGLNAGILSTKTFTIFIVMALVTTFLTTPITSFLYSEIYQCKINKKTSSLDKELAISEAHLQELFNLNSLMVVLTQGQSLYAMMSLIQLFSSKKLFKQDSSNLHKFKAHCTILKELNDRPSDILCVNDEYELACLDPLLNTFRTFSQFLGAKFSSQITASTRDSFTRELFSQSLEHNTDAIIFSWKILNTQRNQELKSNILDHPCNEYIDFILESGDSKFNSLLYILAGDMVNHDFEEITTESSITQQRPCSADSNTVIVYAYFDSNHNLAALNTTIALSHSSRVSTILLLPQMPDFFPEIEEKYIDYHTLNSDFSPELGNDSFDILKNNPPSSNTKIKGIPINKMFEKLIKTVRDNIDEGLSVLVVIGVSSDLYLEQSIKAGTNIDQNLSSFSDSITRCLGLVGTSLIQQVSKSNILVVINNIL